MKKSIARHLLETVLKEEDAPMMKDEPAPEAPAAPAAEAPPSEEPPAAGEENPMQKMAEMLDEPEKMAQALEAMDAQCQKFYDEADADTYTVKDIQEKEDCEQAQAMMKEASMKLKGKMKG